MLVQLFDMYEAESKRVIETPVYWDATQEVMTIVPQEADAASSYKGSMALVYPALDWALKCSHVFNILDARRAVGVTQRATYINRIRARVRACCLKYVEQFGEKAVAKR
jgi:glycyl-tRNA synthetase alpha chain